VAGRKLSIWGKLLRPAIDASRCKLWCFSFACCRCLGAWLRDSRCLRVRLCGLGFGVGGQRLRTRLICCAGVLATAAFLAVLVVGDDSRKEASGDDQDQGHYQGVSKDVFY
jgi:hypothetical protein